MRSIGIMPILDMLGNELYPTGMDKCRGHSKFVKHKNSTFTWTMPQILNCGMTPAPRTTLKIVFMENDI